MDILKDITLVQCILGGLLTYVAWTLKRALASFETSVKDLYEKHDNTNTRLIRVETVHSVRGCDNDIGGKNHG